MDATMTIDTLEKIGTEMFGGNRWGSSMAEVTGLSTAIVSNIRRGISPISTKTEAKILAAYDRYKRPDGVVHDMEGTGLGGDASFGLRMIAVDLLTNKFVGVHNVDPAKFFPEFTKTQTAAPAPVAVAPTLVQVTTNGVTKLAPVADDEALSDADILARIQKRVDVMDEIAAGVLDGYVPSMIVYGAPGIGKSYTIMKAVADRQTEDPTFHADIIKGSIRAPGLYQSLFAARNGGVVVIDDSDSVFSDEESLNLLKAALDSGETRLISWRKQSTWIAELAAAHNVTPDEVTDFEFNGGIIFITNVNLKARANSNEKMAEHFKALISRSYYLDLTMDSPRAKALRVRQVFLDKGMGKNLGLTSEEATEVADFINENRFRLDEISLRMAALITKVYISTPDNWKSIIEVTKMS